MCYYLLNFTCEHNYGRTVQCRRPTAKHPSKIELVYSWVSARVTFAKKKKEVAACGEKTFNFDTVCPSCMAKDRRREADFFEDMRAVIEKKTAERHDEGLPPFPVSMAFALWRTTWDELREKTSTEPPQGPPQPDEASKAAAPCKNFSRPFTGEE